MAGAVAIGQARGLERESASGVPLRRVQGIASSLDDLVLRGERWRANLGEDLIGGTLLRKTSGATELTVEILDTKGKLLRSQLLAERHTLILDGLKFQLVKVSREGRLEPLALTYEPYLVAQLKQIFGPHKAYRDAMTRAEFAKARWLEAVNPKLAALMFSRTHGNGKPEQVQRGPRPKAKIQGARFISPELHVIQDIATAKQGKAAQDRSLEERGKGIDAGATNLTVKGVAATPAQKDAADRALRVAQTENSPRLAMVSMMLALIVESVLGKAASNWYEIEPASVSGWNGDNTDLEAATKGFLQGYNPSEPGAIGEARAHPSKKAYEITQDVQRSSAGDPSHGADNYGPWTKEAERWVDAYTGGDLGEASVTRTQRYAYTQSKDESNWRAMTRLAGEVNWRCFESANYIYFLDEESLLLSRLRLGVNDATPGVLDTSFDYDLGKTNTEITIEAYAKAWAAPPGAAINVDRHGPGDGIYIVDNIESTLASERGGVVTITAKRPTKALPEPAPSTKTESFSLGGAGTGAGELPAAVEKMIAFAESAEGKPYIWGGTGLDARGYDCSGFVSTVLEAGGVGAGHMDTNALAHYGEAGPGTYVTIHDNAGLGDAHAEHVIIQLGDRYWASGEGSPNGGVGEVPPSQLTAAWLAHFGTKRHPKGL